MPGPNSTPNGDTTIIRGHVNEKFVCNVHGDKRLDECEAEIEYSLYPRGRRTNCKIVPLRWYLAERGRLRTGKTAC